MTCLARNSDVKEIQTTAIYSPVKSSVVKGDSSEIVCCPVCNRWFSESRIMVHVNVCADTQGLASC